jgi:hypothetical protein
MASVHSPANPPAEPPAEPPADPPADPPAGSSVQRRRRPDASPWNWLLLLPIVIPLLTPLYNRLTPTLLSFPAFYWLQLSFVLLGVVCTTIVYQLTKRRD